MNILEQWADGAIRSRDAQLATIIEAAWRDGVNIAVSPPAFENADDPPGRYALVTKWSWMRVAPGDPVPVGWTLFDSTEAMLRLDGIRYGMCATRDGRRIDPLDIVPAPDRKAG